MALTSDDVKKVAVLSRLALTEQELQLYTGQLGKILTSPPRRAATSSAPMSSFRAFRAKMLSPARPRRTTNSSAFRQ